MVFINPLLFLLVIVIFSCSRERGKEHDEPEISSSSSQELNYRTVEIGSQVWFAENINDKPSSGVSWCYGEIESYCDEYGRLYDWEAAKSVCPDGWKLPSKDDYDKLLDYVESKNEGYSAGSLLKSVKDWGSHGGSDTYGFSALPGGFRASNGVFSSREARAYFWSSSEADSQNAYYRWIGEDTKLYFSYVKKTEGYSVRCVKG
jgi:uncharacterized protein (TIGR02145 family)